MLQQMKQILTQICIHTYIFVLPWLGKCLHRYISIHSIFRCNRWSKHVCMDTYLCKHLFDLPQWRQILKSICIHTYIFVRVYMYICTHMCSYMHICTYMYVYMYICVYAHIYADIYITSAEGAAAEAARTNTYINVYAHIYIHTQICTQVCMHIYMLYMCICTYICIHIFYQCGGCCRRWSANSGHTVSRSSLH